VVMPVTDMFWGDRFGAVDDPSGHRWGLATHVEDPTPEQMAQRQKEFFASMARK
jgi:PhnB protein